MIRATRRYRFPAAHVLAQPRLSDVENRRIYGKCANPNGHGHDYAIEIGVEGRADPRSGWIVPPDELDALVRERVVDVLSYRLLNELPSFQERVPTAENVALVIHEALSAPIARQFGARLASVGVRETPRNFFVY